MNDVAVPPKKVKQCRFCALEIPAEAVKCTNCDSWQNWRGALNFSIPVLSLILAILTVIFSSGREFYEFITSKPKFDVLISDITFKASPQLSPGDLRMQVINSEARYVLVQDSLWCDAYNMDARKGGLHMHFLRLYGPDGKVDTAGSFAVPANSHNLEVFSDIEFSGAPIGEIIQKLARVRFTCDMTYSYDGQTHTLRKPYERIILIGD